MEREEVAIKKRKRIDPERQLLDMRQASRILGIGYSRLYMRVARKEIPPRIITRIGNRIYFLRPAMDAWLAGEEFHP